MNVLACALGCYVLIALILAVFSAKLKWGTYFEPEDMWAWPIMLALLVGAAPVLLIIGFGISIGYIARKINLNQSNKILRNLK